MTLYWLADWLYSHLRKLEYKREPDFLIGNPDDPYLMRWYLVPRNPIMNVYLHKMLHSDDDRALHDHPWPSMSICLHGLIGELYSDWGSGVQYFRYNQKGAVVFRSATMGHRLIIENGPAWTLFITGPRVRNWGFWCPQGWRPWQEFCDPGEKGRVGKGCD